MDDLKQLTVRYLRALARKHIGRGHSKLKTKTQLLAALKSWLPRALVAKPVRRAKTGARPTKSAVAAKVTTLARAQRSAAASPTERTDWQPGAGVSKHAAQHQAEPLIEGFFVARVAGEGEVRRHRLTEASTAPSAGRANGGGMADLPEGDGDLRMHALARDPGTLFAFWDFPKPSWQHAARGLDSPRAVLRVFQGEQLVRELEFAPESRSFYVHHLSPGQQYRVEAHLLGSDGRSKRVGHPSAIVELPRSGYSEGEARFAQLDWGSDLRGTNGERARIMDAERARTLAAGFQEWMRPVDASSERRGWLFSPSASRRP